MKKWMGLMAFVFLVLDMAAFGQQAGGINRHTDFSGVLTNRQGSPVAGATVYLLNTNRSVISDDKGLFLFKKLEAGNYTIEITAIGYAKIDREIILTGQEQAGKIQRVDFQLEKEITKLDEVVVTAQKKEELLQQVPISISAIPSKKVRDYRLWNNKEITAIVPNLYAADPGDGRDVISIRGITTTSYDPAVATYIDGVNQFGSDTYIPGLLDVERIEILRGPQGTLYGRNAMGGVINIITRQPSNKTSGFAELNLGNYNQQRYSAGLRTPLIKDKLFLGVAGLYDGRNGYYTNLFTNQSYDKQHSFTGNYYVKYLPDAHWVIDLNVKHRNNRNHGAFPLVFGAEDAVRDPFVLNQNATTTMVDNTLNVSLAANYAGPSFNFTSQTAYQKNYRYYSTPIDGDFSPLDAVSVINNYGKPWNNVKAVTHEFKFTSPAASSSPWKWTAGAYLFFQDAPNKQATRYGTDANLIGAGDSLFTTLSTTKSHKWGMAYYGQATYALSKKVNLTAGLRYDYEHQRQEILAEYQHDPDPSFMKIQPDTAGNTSFGAFSPKLAIDYHLSANSLLYGVYSRGFRTGGMSQYSFQPGSPPLVGFKPEYSSNYEVGIKNSLWHNALRVNLAAFYSHINDAQVPTLVLPDAITVTRNSGRLNNMGVEAEISAAPFRGLSVDYNFGYTHSRFESLNLSQNGSAVDLSGKRQIFTPDVTYMLAAQYNYPFGGQGQYQAIVRCEWKYIGQTYFDLNNSIGQSSYSLYNLRLGVAAKNLEVFFWARNLGDKKYISYAYDFGGVHLGDPKTYGVTVYTKF
ncbi:TonB-dependent receptor [Flavitalea flava]